MICQSLRYVSRNDVYVPCGRCAFCTATRRSDWALRLHYEQKKHVGSKFVTLTYADAHLVWKDGNSQLCKEHLQKFFKRLRKRGNKLRYYAIGEYGSKTFRPHYHIILFGDVPEDDIRKSWRFGHVHIGAVNSQSIMYCLGYIVNGSSWKMRKDRVKPFSLMSRRPGLGMNYLTKSMIEWHRSDRRNYALLDGKKRHLPRYYKEKIFSRIDRVRIAVREQKEAFKRDVQWLRHPSRAAMKDPLGYREEQLKRLARSIRMKTKNSNQI